MAKVTQKFKEVEKIVKEKVNGGVTIELSDLEANLIYFLLGRTSGNSLYNLYKDLNQIYGPWDWNNPVEKCSIVILSDLEYFINKNKGKTNG